VKLDNLSTNLYFLQSNNLPTNYSLMIVLAKEENLLSKFLINLK